MRQGKQLHCFVCISDGLLEAIEAGTVNPSMLYYEDECPILAQQLPSKGRIRKGEKLFVRQPYRASRYAMIAVISCSKWIKVDLIKGSVNDTAFKTFCLEEQVTTDDAKNLGGPPLSALIPPRSFLIMDRLGRSGRCLEPCKIHYNTEVHEELLDNQVAIKMLPPKGSILNPIEVFNAVIQAKVVKHSKQGTDEYNRNVPVGPRNFEEARIALSNALEELKDKPWIFEGFYKKRAFGDELIERMEGSKEARKAIKERMEVLINEKFNEFEE